MNIMAIVKLVPLIVAAVQAVEGLITGHGRGKEKQDAAVDMVRTLLPLIEEFVGKDLLDDAAVQAAVRSAIDALVAVQNTVTAARAAVAAKPPQPGS